MKNSARVFAAIVPALILAGCGYHVGGQGDLIPKNIKTIAIPTFGNGTVRAQVNSMLTADVVREFHSRTHYKIVTDPSQADAVLNGSVINLSTLGGTTTDPVTGRATSSQIILSVSFTLTDKHTNKPITARSGYEFRDGYEISTNLPQYLDESGPAVERVCQQAARGIVTSILEAF